MKTRGKVVLVALVFRRSRCYLVKDCNSVSPPRQIMTSRSSGVTKPKGGIDKKAAKGKVFACKHSGCSKLFSKRYNLKAHARLHTGNTPFCCPRIDCGREFKWRSSVSSHAAWHLRKDAGEIVRECSPKQKSKRKPRGDTIIHVQSVQRVLKHGTCKGSPCLPSQDQETQKLAQELLHSRVDDAKRWSTSTSSADEFSLAPDPSPSRQHNMDFLNDLVIPAAERSELSTSLVTTESYESKHKSEKGRTCPVPFDEVGLRLSLVQSGLGAACEAGKLIDGMEESDLPDFCSVSRGHGKYFVFRSSPVSDANLVSDDPFISEESRLLAASPISSCEELQSCDRLEAKPDFACDLPLIF